jgi:hypothetical protein
MPLASAILIAAIEGIPGRVGARPLTASAGAEAVKGERDSRTRTHLVFHVGHGGPTLRQQLRENGLRGPQVGGGVGAGRACQDDVTLEGRLV